MIPGDILSAFPHRLFHTLPGLLDSWAALPNYKPNACVSAQGGSLYNFHGGLWYDPAGERRTDRNDYTRICIWIIRGVFTRETFRTKIRHTKTLQGFSSFPNRLLRSQFHPPIALNKRSLICQAIKRNSGEYFHR